MYILIFWIYLDNTLYVDVQVNTTYTDNIIFLFPALSMTSRKHEDELSLVPDERADAKEVNTEIVHNNQCQGEEDIL